MTTATQEGHVTGSKIESQAIDEFSYNEGQQTLTIRFAKGNTGRYRGVPREIVGQMLMAPSAGAFFVAEIRNKFAYEPVAA